MNWIKNLQQAGARHHGEVLEALSSYAAKNQRDIPTVILYLSSGISLEGQVLAQRPSRSVVFYQPQSNQTLTYLDLTQIVGIGFQSIERIPGEVLQEVLGFSRDLVLAPMNKIDFQRFVAAESDSLNKLMQVTIQAEKEVLTLAPEKLAFVRQHMEDVLQVLSEIWQDALGMEAIAEKIKTINAGSTTGVSAIDLREQVLHLSINPEKIMNPAGIKTRIESLL